MKRIFKYYPSDFGKLTVKVLHMDLDFDIFDAETKVKCSLKAKALTKLSKLELDANNVELKSVNCDATEISYVYFKDKNKLIINFKKPISKNSIFTITTENITRPTKNVLEGLYYDETPKDSPPTMITQCQQWGFQRLTPCIDDMTAKCTYITTITANSKYTNMISNGDVSKLRKTIAPGRDRIVYDNTKTPMAPYLFFLGVGTYSTFTKEVEYADGDKFMLELLVHPGSKKDIADKALQILHDSIIWVHLFTGADKYKNNAVSEKILQLIKERELLKEKNSNLSDIRKKLKDLSKGLTLGYKYTGAVYREIAMQNSDFGGMENVGNTTITANRIMPYSEMTDPAFEYLIRVKVHEYYHNLNGSEVTGWSPFEIWLNEAVTVHVEKEFQSFIFGDDYVRLEEVLGLLSPDRGTFASDSGVASMPVEPDGFNDPNELITGITYVKAPEFVRMIETLIGQETFVKGLALYHKLYKHSNATKDNWLECMEKVSGKSLKKIAQLWLKKREYPMVELKSSYDEKKKKVVLELNQINATEKDAWQFPFKFALFDENKKFSEATQFVNKKRQKIELASAKKPLFISFNRGCSFYGKVIYKYTKEELLMRFVKEDDMVNKYMAFYYLMDLEKTKLIKDSGAAVGSEIIDLYFSALSNDLITKELGSSLNTIFESVEDEKYNYKYQLLYDVKKKILKSVALKYKLELMKLYEKKSSASKELDYLRREVSEIKRRQIKNACLGLLSLLDTPDIHIMIKKQFETANCATEKIVAFRAYINSSAKDKNKLLEEYELVAKKNLVSWELFLLVVGSNDSDDYLDIIKRVEKSSTFRIEQSSDQRSLYSSFASNKRKSLLTKEGREFLTEKIIQLSTINEYSTVGILNVFGDVDKMDDDVQPEMIKMLLEILKNVDAKKSPSVYNTAKRILLKLPKATKNYKKKYGKFNLE